jgi:outer membrane protein TolC
MEPSHPKRFPFARNGLLVLAAALIVFGGAVTVDQTAGAEPGVEPPKDSAVEAAVLSPPAPRLLPPTTDARLVMPEQLSEPVRPTTTLQASLADALRMPEVLEDLPPGQVTTEEVYPIDLPSALQLAGANNLQIALARERVNQAAARAAAANVLWIPSISAGAVYNNHAGRIQGTEGEILEVSRNSLFVGGGAVFGNSPANGGASGPARMFVDLSLADTIFEPLAARQLVRATAANRTATFNDTLLQVAATYLTLARAQARVRITEEAVANAEELARITDEFAKSGHGLQADADRAIVEAASRRRDVLQAEEGLAVVSAELARLLRLDPAVRLQAVDETPVPLEFVDQSLPLESLIGQAVAARPEITSADAERDAAGYRRRQEQLRPWMPHLYAGASGGGFGGGEGADVTNFSDRADFDVAAIWQFENLGFGNAARQREQQSLYRQANLAIQQVRDLIAAEVTQAYQRVQFRQRQIDVTRPQIESAQQAVKLNLEGIRGGVLRPIEIQQAIGALALARTQHLDAVVDYNVAQLQMLRAVGRPPEMVAHNDRANEILK